MEALIAGVMLGTIGVMLVVLVALYCTGHLASDQGGRKDGAA